MSDNGRIIPGHYIVKSATITSFAGGSPNVDIMPLFTNIYIEESIQSDGISGSIQLVDKIGFLEDLPVRGEETLEFTIEDAAGTEKTFVFAIYKVSDVQITKTNDGLTYTLHFVSQSKFDAVSRKIIAPYEDNIDNIVKDVFDTYYSSYGKSLVIDEKPTEGIFRCIIPNYTPPQAMNFLASRAYSELRPSCSYRFFETHDNFFFISDEGLIERAFQNSENIKEFIFSDAVPKDGSALETELKNLVSIRSPEKVNTFKDLLSGAYRSNSIVADLIQGNASLPNFDDTYRYNYQERKGSYTSTAGRGITGDVHSAEFTDYYFTEENEKLYFVLRDWDTVEGNQLRGEQYLPEIASNRTAYRHHLNNTTVDALSPGRLDVSAGDIVNLVIPQFTSSPDKVLNPQLSGNYLVKKVGQVFERDVHQTAMTLVKYDWST